MIDTSKSDFFHFGTLPQVCIHSLMEDEYSKMYIPREKCDCGNASWVEGEMNLAKNITMIKKVHRCSKCNGIRMADHIGSTHDN